jgi:hypothetical protein
LIREAHGYAIVEKVPHLFDEAIAQLASPLARQECFYYRTALQKFRSIRQSLSAL